MFGAKTNIQIHTLTHTHTNNNLIYYSSPIFFPNSLTDVINKTKMQESKQKYTKQKKTVLYTKQTFATAVSFRVCLESRERHQSLSKCVGVCVPIRVLV